MSNYLTKITLPKSFANSLGNVTLRFCGFRRALALDSPDVLKEASASSYNRLVDVRKEAQPVKVQVCETFAFGSISQFPDLLALRETKDTVRVSLQEYLFTGSSKVTSCGFWQKRVRCPVID